METASLGAASAGLRTAVRFCRRSVRAGAFACELATRRRWLGARDTQWIAENLSALRGFAVDVSGVSGGTIELESAALVVAEPSAHAALAVLAAVPFVGSVGPSLWADGEPWWPRGPGVPVLLSTGDREELADLARAHARVVPVAVRLTPPLRGALGGLWPVRSGVTQVRLHFGAPLRLGPAGQGHDIGDGLRDEIDRLLPAAA
jgi:hypothetical protein